MVNALTLQSTQVYDCHRKGAGGASDYSIARAVTKAVQCHIELLGSAADAGSLKLRLDQANKQSSGQILTVRQCTICRKSQCCVICNDVQQVAENQEAYPELDEVNTYSQYSQVTRPKHAAYPSQSIVTAL